MFAYEIDKQDMQQTDIGNGKEKRKTRKQIGKIETRQQAVQKPVTNRTSKKMGFRKYWKLNNSYEYTHA